MERRIDLHLRVSYEPRVLRPWLALCVLLLCAGELGSENVTLTTYYPAPSGAYTRIVTTGDTWLARDGGRVGIGMLNPASPLQVQSPLPIVGAIGFGDVLGNIWSDGGADGWFTIRNTAAGGRTSFLSNTAAEIMSINNSGNVGIGTPNPAYKLDVVGGEIKTDGIKGAGCYNVPFGNTLFAPTRCGDVVNERVIAVNYNNAALFRTGSQNPGSTENVSSIATTGTMMCCRLRP